MWSNGAVWSAAGYYAYSGSLSGCLSRLYEELQAGRPVIVHLKNTAVSGVSKHTNRVTSYEYHQLLISGHQGGNELLFAADHTRQRPAAIGGGLALESHPSAPRRRSAHCR